VATVPHLVQTILGRHFDSKAAAWARLHKGGHARQLLFATVQAIDAGADGLIAIVDRDRAPSRSRLQAMKEGRESHRRDNPPFATALGEANPHVDVWLLDDPVAVSSALGIADADHIPNIRRVEHPKTELDRLIGAFGPSSSSKMEILAQIAQKVDPTRCAHSKETGFDALQKEVAFEIGRSIASA
jgi:hypothetical protein